VPEVLQIRLVDPIRGPAKQAEQSCRFGRQQPLQPHQQAPEGAQFGAANRNAMPQQGVFDVIHPGGRLAHNVHQDAGLVLQQVRQQICR